MRCLLLISIVPAADTERKPPQHDLHYAFAGALACEFPPNEKPSPMMPAALEGYLVESNQVRASASSSGLQVLGIRSCSAAGTCSGSMLSRLFLLKIRKGAAHVNAANYLRPLEAAMLAPMALMLSLQQNVTKT